MHPQSLEQAAAQLLFIVRMTGWGQAAASYDMRPGKPRGKDHYPFANM